MTAPNQLGKYALIARVGRGGMAEIFLARQRGAASFSRVVVIKRILPHLAGEPHFVRMFLEEARLAALISHPNVVQIYDVDQHQGHYYIAMEYIDGPSLGMVMRKLRRSGGRLPFAVAAEVVAQTCDGLHAAHELCDDTGRALELVHRDISPHNLMVNEAGLVKLVDFGIAKAQGSAVRTSTGHVKGKYPYMSPEQCRGERLDRRTDLFSLGVVFFELMTGQRVFQRQTELMILKAITEEPIPHPRDLRPDIPEELSRVVDGCLQRDREKRFRTAAELGQAVRAALAALGESTSPALLRDYLAATHGELLVSRAEALRRALASQSDEGPVPEVDGLDGKTGPDDADPTASARTLLEARSAARRRLRWSLLSALLIVLAAGAGLVYRFLHGAPPFAGPPLVVAMPPSFPTALTEEGLRPLLRYLERRLQRPVQLVVTPDYRALRAGLLAGRYHLANLPPLQFVLARHQSARLRALVTNLYEGARTYQALLVALDGSGIAGPADLRGRRICYVDPGSTSGYLLARDYLRRLGVDPARLFRETRFSGNHIAVLQDLVDDRCDVGAIYSGAQVTAAAHGFPASRMRIIAVTGQLPYDVLCAAPDLPDSLRGELRQALLEFDPARDLGRPIVSETYRISGFITPRPEEFDGVERAARSEGLIK